MRRRNELSDADVRVLLRAECHLAGSQRAWAKAHGVSAAYVSDVLSDRRNPGRSILAPLGLIETTRYVRTYAPETAQ
jgi:hypothetical protein